MKAELLRISNIVLGNRPVQLNLTIYEHEILAVCGLSDSGIFDLADLLSGMTPMTTGSLWVQERPMPAQWLRNPSHNWIFRFQKTPAVLPQLTVAENIFVVSGKKKPSFVIDYSEINSLAEDILKEVGLHVSPQTIVEELSLVEIHIIELIRATYFGARLIILDDVFDSYSPAERQFTYQVIQTLHDIGISFLIFSSEHEELSSLFHRLNIIRDGENIKSLAAADYDNELVYRYMLGGPSLPMLYPPLAYSEADSTTPVFSAKHICSTHLNDISFSVYPNEIFSLMDTHAFSLHRFLDVLLGGAPYTGEFCLNGKKIKHTQRDSLAQLGLGVLDYKDSSCLFDTLSWADNLALMYRNRLGRNTPLSASKCAQFLAKEYAHLLEGLPSDIPLMHLQVSIHQRTTLKYLCWIVRKPAVLLCIRPHATTDVIMRSAVDQMLQLAVSKGICIIIASSNPKEAVTCANRIACLDNGSISQILSNSEFTF